MQILEAEILEKDEEYLPGGMQALVTYRVRLEDGTLRDFQGHGWSLTDSEGVFRASYFLRFGPPTGFFYCYYQAKPLEAAGDYDVWGYSFSNDEPVERFEGTLRDIRETKESLKDFAKRTLVGREALTIRPTDPSDYAGKCTSGSSSRDKGVHLKGLLTQASPPIGNRNQRS